MGLFHIFEQKSMNCVFIEVHRQPQFTCHADSSLTPSVTLLAHSSGTAYRLHTESTVVNLQGPRNDTNESRPGSVIGVSGYTYRARVWLSYQAIIWISVLVRLFRVFQIQSHIRIRSTYKEVCSFTKFHKASE